MTGALRRPEWLKLKVDPRGLKDYREDPSQKIYG